MADSIVVRTTTQVGTYPPGAELGYRTEDDARAILGDGNYTVVRLQSGQPAPKAKADAPNLGTMKRDELEAYAEQVGLAGPYDQYANKDELITAIEDHQKSA